MLINTIIIRNIQGLKNIKQFNPALIITIYFAAWYPRYKDEILLMNHNITLKNREKIIILNKRIGNI